LAGGTRTRHRPPAKEKAMTTLDTETHLTTAPTDLIRLCLAAAVVAPTLLLLASVTGIASGDVNTSGWSGGVLIMAFAAYGPAFVGMAIITSPRVPALARVVLVMGGLVAAGGAGFGGTHQLQQKCTPLAVVDTSAVKCFHQPLMPACKGLG
jgi:hypothetical protein